MKTKILNFFICLMASTILYGCKSKPLPENKLVNGYKLLTGKNLFQILVSEKYPDNQSMIFIKENGEISFRLDDSLVGTKSVSVSVGVNENVSANVQFGQSDVPEELVVILSSKAHNDQLLRDINLDGIWDIKVLPQQNQQYVFMDSDWKLVDRIVGKWPDISAQIGETKLIFDRTVNSWKNSAN